MFLKRLVLVAAFLVCGFSAANAYTLGSTIDSAYSSVTGGYGLSISYRASDSGEYVLIQDARNTSFSTYYNLYAKHFSPTQYAQMEAMIRNWFTNSVNITSGTNSHLSLHFCGTVTANSSYNAVSITTIFIQTH